MADGSSSAGGANNEPTTKRLEPKKQSLDDAYAAPANLLEIEVAEPENHGFGRQRYTDYEIRMRVSLTATVSAEAAKVACLQSRSRDELFV